MHIYRVHPMYTLTLTVSKKTTLKHTTYLNYVEDSAAAAPAAFVAASASPSTKPDPSAFESCACPSRDVSSRALTTER